MNITIYTMKSCRNCARLKKLLEKEGRKYKESAEDRPGEKPQIHYRNKYFDLWLVGYKECRDFIKRLKL